MGMGGGEEIKTRLLKESDLVEGGSPKKFIVFDQLNNRQTYFDAETGYWEGEQAWEITGKEAQQENLIPGMTQGFVPDMSGFNPEIDPQIWGTVDVVLKDGSGERFSRRQVLQRHRAKPRHPGRIGKTLRPEPGIHPARCGQQAQLCVYPARQEVAGLRAERFVNPLSPSMEGVLWGAFFFWLRPQRFLRIFPPRCGQLDADVFAVALARLRELGEFLLENAFYPRSR